MRIRTLPLVCIVLVIFSLSTLSFSSESEVKIGYSLRNSWFHFNVPVTEIMINTIQKVEGVSSVLRTLDKYQLMVNTGKMFSRKAVIDRIVDVLEKEIFKGKTVKLHSVD